MKSVLLKYMTIIWCVSMIAINFIACGSQMYQVSVRHDYEEQTVNQQNPDVGNPNSELYGIHATDGWVKLPIQYRFDARLNSEQRKHLLLAMKIWEATLGVKLFVFSGVHQGTTGDTFKDLYSSLDDNINGNYLDDDWTKTKKPEEVLATTIWSTSKKGTAITTADIRFNNHSYKIGDSLMNQAEPGKEVVDMQSLALHELGHLLGLAHVESEVDQYSIMNPTLYIGEGLVARDLSAGDLKRIQRIYGCKLESCEEADIFEKIKTLQKQELVDPIVGH